MDEAEPAAHATVLSINPALYLYTGRRTVPGASVPIIGTARTRRDTLAQFANAARVPSQLQVSITSTCTGWITSCSLRITTAEAVRAVQANAKCGLYFKAAKALCFSPPPEVSPDSLE